MDTLLGITAGDWWTLLRENRFAVDPTYWRRAGMLTVAKRLADAPSRKHPMDNMEVAFNSPGEDEFAISMMSLRSSLIGWSFPRREEHCERYLTFQGVSEKEVERWKAALVVLLKKLTYKYRRPLVLKSPVHTARIRLLLEMFPDARFVHIHRNPYTVFQSTRWLYEKTVSNGYLQYPQAEHINDGILRRYIKMYDAFFEDLKKDMLDQVGSIYENFGIPGFRDAEPAFRRYVDSIASYKKNVYPPCPSR